MECFEIDILFQCGVILLGDSIIMEPKWKLSNVIEKLPSFFDWKISSKKKGGVIRCDSEFKWCCFPVASIIFRFNGASIKSVVLGFYSDEYRISAVAEHPIAERINLILSGFPSLRSNQEIAFSLPYGSVRVQYDLHMLAVGVEISYK